jgi:hypothetical protein
MKSAKIGIICGLALFLLAPLLVGQPARVNHPPVVFAAPDALLPYLPAIRREPVFREWLLRHPTTKRPLSDFIEDTNEPMTDRQRAWQFREKIRDRRER